MNEQDKKLTVKESAAVLGVSPFTLRSWIRERRLPFFRCGRRIVFSKQDLEQFLSTRRVFPVEMRTRMSQSH